MPSVRYKSLDTCGCQRGTFNFPLLFSTSCHSLLFLHFISSISSLTQCDQIRNYPYPVCKHYHYCTLRMKFIGDQTFGAIDSQDLGKMKASKNCVKVIISSNVSLGYLASSLMRSRILHLLSVPTLVALKSRFLIFQILNFLDVFQNA